MISLWIQRILFSSSNIFRLKTLLSFIGLVVAVACLIITLTVMSSYEKTLSQTLIDRVGHLVISKRQKQNPQTASDIFQKIEPFIKSLNPSATPFVMSEALALANGSLSGVLLEGLDIPSSKKVINIQNQIIEGSFIQNSSHILVGFELAKKLKASVGSWISITVPQINQNSKHAVPKFKKFKVIGLLDMGHYDFNTRYAIVSLPSAQKLLGLSPKNITGLRIRLDSSSSLDLLSMRIKEELGTSFFVRTWKSINQNLFTSIEMEKKIIFFVLLILVIAAAFNISNQLLIDVLRRFREIGILKAMGASSSMIVQLFLVQCLIISAIGTLVGLFLGVLTSYGLLAFYDLWGMVAPSDIYKLNKIILSFKWEDFVSVFVFSIVICLLGSWIPIKRALSLSPRQGLGYE